MKDRKAAAGLAIVKFASESVAAKAAQDWEGKEFDGRPVWVSRYVSVAAHSHYCTPVAPRSRRSAAGMDSWIGPKSTRLPLQSDTCSPVFSCTNTSGYYLSSE